MVLSAVFIILWAVAIKKLNKYKRMTDRDVALYNVGRARKNKKFAEAKGKGTWSYADVFDKHGLDAMADEYMDGNTWGVKPIMELK